MLNCEECATPPATGEEALRWRAYLIAVVDDGDEEVAVYCPECADREFGDSAVWISVPALVLTRAPNRRVPRSVSGARCFGAGSCGCCGACGFCGVRRPLTVVPACRFGVAVRSRKRRTDVPVQAPADGRLPSRPARLPEHGA
jgi:hypothetical protein